MQSLKEIKQDERFIEYLYQFNIKRDYFYCHDLLEEIWLETNRQYDVLKYLIQLAIMQYKKITKNEIGFNTLFQKSLHRLNAISTDLARLGIDALTIEVHLLAMQEKNTFHEFDLLIKDQDIKTKLLEKEKEHGKIY
jgi:uncharacterized protein